MNFYLRIYIYINVIIFINAYLTNLGFLQLLHFYEHLYESGGMVPHFTITFCGQLGYHGASQGVRKDVHTCVGTGLRPGI